MQIQLQLNRSHTQCETPGNRVQTGIRIDNFLAQRHEVGVEAVQLLTLWAHTSKMDNADSAPGGKVHPHNFTSEKEHWQTSELNTKYLLFGIRLKVSNKFSWFYVGRLEYVYSVTSSMKS